MIAIRLVTRLLALALVSLLTWTSCRAHETFSGGEHEHNDHEHLEESCGLRSTPEQEKELLQQVTAWKTQHYDHSRQRVLINDKNVSYKIPVQFTVMQPPDLRGNITDQQIEDTLMTTLNKGFHDSPFSFYTVGVERAVNESWFKCRDEFTYKSIYKKGCFETLNVYLCNTFAINYGVYAVSNLPDINRSNAVIDGTITSLCCWE